MAQIYDVSLGGFRPLSTTDLAGMGGGGSGADRELVVTTYRVKTAFSGASVGDTITATQVIDVSAAPTTVSTIWRNQTTAADLGSAPLAANLEIVGAQALTDAQLRASAVVVSAPALSNLDADLGATTDAVATSDTGTFSVIALVKRSLQNWTTLLGRIPALVSGRIPVDGSGVTQPVSGPLTSAQLAAAALATDAVAQAIRDRLPSALAGGRLNVEPLGIPSVARQQATTTSTANVALTVGVARISLFARNAPLRYVVGSSAQTANAATSHYLAAGERIDIDVPTTPHIAVIRASDATADGAAEITELS